MRSFSHQLSIFGLLCGVAACGKVSSPAQTDGDIPGGDGQGPVNCEFTKAGTSCAFPPHVPVEPMRTCFGAAAPAVLDPPVGATLTFRKSGAAYQLDCSPGCGGAATTIASQEALFQMNAPLIELFCFQKVNIAAGVTVRADPTFDHAIALLARDAITVGGSIDFSGAEAMDVQGGAGGPGGYAGGGRIAPYNGGGPCGGVGGSPQGGSATTGSGGGGGGNAGAGGNGGAGNPSPAGVAGGCARPYAKLEGGSGGGGGGTGVVLSASGTSFGSQFAGSGGGGALALISRTSVAVASTATIAANGAQGHIIANNGSFNYNQLGGTGGGAGGTIVIAAPTVDVAGALRVQGGNGRVAWGAGGAGAQGNTLNGAIGGNGAANTYGGAGGGGAGGYVRIFSSAGTAQCATSASPAPGCAKAQLANTPAAP